jgi:uncharacterized membrane protein
MCVSCSYRYLLGIHDGQCFLLIYVVHGICVLLKLWFNKAGSRAAKNWLLSWLIRCVLNEGSLVIAAAPSVANVDECRQWLRCKYT